MKKYISPMHPLVIFPDENLPKLSLFDFSVITKKKTLNMQQKTRRAKALAATYLMAIVFLAFPMIINASDSSSNRKLEEDPIKCISCLQNPPPPSPPPPSLSCPPPPPPPSPPKKSYCPPPPSTYLYMTGPPGELYPVDMQFGAAAGKSFTVVKILGLLTLGVMGFLMNMN